MINPGTNMCSNQTPPAGKLRRSRYWIPTTKILATPLFAAALLLASGCGTPGGDGTTRLAPTRGVIFISLDTLRADHLSSYGYHRPTSPFIDSLAERGVLFENAFVQLPGTLPSHMSMFTGLYPAEHDVYPPSGVLSAEIPTLPEILQAAGFRTGG